MVNDSAATIQLLAARTKYYYSYCFFPFIFAFFRSLIMIGFEELIDHSPQHIS